MIRRLLALMVLVCGMAGTASALMIAPPPPGQRIATAQVVIVGKVTKVSEKAVAAEMFKGDGRQMSIVTLKVDQTLLGKPGKEIQVGLVLPPPPPPPGAPRLSSRGLFVQLVVDQEALLMLQPHPTKKGVMVPTDFFGVINKQGNPNFANELAEIKKSTQMLNNRMAGLKSKDANERFLTTALLITRYRTPMPGSTAATEKVPLQESKLILENLAEVDWKSANEGRMGFAMTPQSLFFRLELQPSDGWKQPTDFAKVPEAAKEWLKANAGKYQLKAFPRPALESIADPEP